ncbi:PPE family protein [Mycobacterium tuberculosis]|nr:PPE family protein [Mycobacterium tuberculosis]
MDPEDAEDTGDLVGAVAASATGAGPQGFAGTATKAGAGRAAGLTTLPNEFGSGPRMPMIPGTWDTETPPDDDGR